MTKSKNGVLVFSISGFDALADKVATCGGWYQVLRQILL